MKKKILYFMLTILLLFISMFLIYLREIKHFVMPGNKIMIEVVNKSPENISKINIFHSTNIIEEQGVKQGSSKVVYVETSGESTYSIEAVFEKGKKLKSNETYAETGYFMEETIFSDSISTSYKF